MELVFTFTAELYPWESNPSIRFVDVPVDETEDIREFVHSRRSAGSVPVKVQIGDTKWNTSVFGGKNAESFVLPIKKAVRVAEKIDIGDEAEVTFTVQVD